MINLSFSSLLKSTNFLSELIDDENQADFKYFIELLKCLPESRRKNERELNHFDSHVSTKANQYFDQLVSLYNKESIQAIYIAAITVFFSRSNSALSKRCFELMITGLNDTQQKWVPRVRAGLKVWKYWLESKEHTVSRDRNNLFSKTLLDLCIEDDVRTDDRLKLRITLTIDGQYFYIFSRNDDTRKLVDLGRKMFPENVVILKYALLNFIIACRSHRRIRTENNEIQDAVTEILEIDKSFPEEDISLSREIYYNLSLWTQPQHASYQTLLERLYQSAMRQQSDLATGRLFRSIYLNSPSDTYLSIQAHKYYRDWAENEFKKHDTLANYFEFILELGHALYAENFINGKNIELQSHRSKELSNYSKCMFFKALKKASEIYQTSSYFVFKYYICECDFDLGRISAQLLVSSFKKNAQYNLPGTERFLIEFAPRKTGEIKNTIHISTFKTLFHKLKEIDKSSATRVKFGIFCLLSEGEDFESNIF